MHKFKEVASTNHFVTFGHTDFKRSFLVHSQFQNTGRGDYIYFSSMQMASQVLTCKKNRNHAPIMETK